jgi:hypothetical protein
MAVDRVLNILRYSALILTFAMAVIALLRKTKRDDGQLTRAGKWYFALIIFSVLVAFGTQIAEDVRQEQSTAEQLKRNAHLLEQVIRGQYPLQNIRASYQFSVPAALPGVEQYQRRLGNSMSQIVPWLSSPRYRQLNDIRFAMVEPDIGIMFCEKSALMPSATKDPDAARFVASLNVRLLFYRKPVEPGQWPLFVFTGSDAVQPDAEMWFSGGDRCIEYRTKPQRLILRDIGAGSNASQWQSSGIMLSVLDLRGAQMVVDVHPRRTDQSQGQLLLEDFELFIGSLQALWLPKTRFTARQLPNSDIAYEFDFPRTLEEILSLQRRYGSNHAN